MACSYNSLAMGFRSQELAEIEKKNLIRFEDKAGKEIEAAKDTLANY